MAKCNHLFFLSITFTFIFASCSTNVEDLSGTIVIDPAEVSYTQDIQPIFSSSCAGSGCHISNTPNGVNLSSYANVMSSIGLVYDSPIVIPGNPEGSPLIDKLEPNPENGARMPQTGDYLSTQNIELIKAWIEGGANDD